MKLIYVSKGKILFLFTSHFPGKNAVVCDFFFIEFELHSKMKAIDQE